jgi:class 3 adenylate cyclase
MTRSDSLDVWDLIGEQGRHARQQLNEAKSVVPGNLPIDVGDLAVQAARWTEYQVVAVVADMVGSTNLGAGGQWERSTASIYDAAVTPMAEIFSQFGADFIDIQGDGGFGLFTGALATERAVCAAVTVRTFSEMQLMPALTAKWGDKAPQTGFKLGVASSKVLAKKVGIPRTKHQEPVWAGRAVNHAAKCAQEAGRHRVLVTEPVAKAVRGNDYLYFSCGCRSGAGPTAELWAPTPIAKLANAPGLSTKSAWCDDHGSYFVSQVLAGESRRPDTRQLRAVETQRARSA